MAPESANISPARRLAAWTSRGIVTAIIVLMGLTAGRQIIAWWHTPPATPVVPSRTSGPNDGLGNPAVPHVLEFGQTGWSLRRAEIQGDQEAAQTALLGACKMAVPNASVPRSPAPQAELHMLEDLRSREPLAAEGRLWGIYRIEGPFPILVGVRPLLPSPRNEGSTVAVSGCRVVTWGLAAPVDQNRWTVYAFGSGGGESASAVGIDVPLPPGCTRQLAVRAERGGRVTSFHGPGPVVDWMRFFDEWFGARGWKADRDWRTAASSHQMRYSEPTAGGATVDLHLRGAAPRAEGFIVITGASRPPGSGSK